MTSCNEPETKHQQPIAEGPKPANKQQQAVKQKLVPMILWGILIKSNEPLLLSRSKISSHSNAHMGQMSE